MADELLILTSARVSLLCLSVRLLDCVNCPEQTATAPTLKNAPSELVRDEIRPGRGSREADIWMEIASEPETKAEANKRARSREFGGGAGTAHT